MLKSQWVVDFAVLLLLLLLHSNLTPASEASQARMAEEALVPLVGTRDTSEQQRRLTAQKQLLDENTGAHPDEVRSATIVFGQGQATHGLVNFAARHNLTVIQVQTKQPMNDDGMIFSSFIGLDDLLAIDGTLEQRLTYALAMRTSRMRQKAVVYSRSPQEVIRKRGQEYTEMLKEEPQIFGVDVISSSQSLTAASNEEIVAGIFLDASDAKVLTYEYRKRNPVLSR